MGRLSLVSPGLRRAALVVVLAASCSFGGQSAAPPEPAPASNQRPLRSHAEPMLPSPTLGGRQFWSDQLVLHDYRIQQHVHTGHFRLLDEADRRLCSGSFDACYATLERLQTELAIPPLGREVVIVLHGLGRSRKSMEGLVDFLRKHSDFSVLNVSYASTRSRIEQHSQVLASVVAHASEADEIHFVAHSMGNLIVRHFLGQLSESSAVGGQETLNRIGRIVMLAPPNQGAILAERFKDNPLFRVFWGASGAQIAEWDSIRDQLAIPSGEFGVLAGGKGNATGHNRLIQGDDDFVVSVDETRLVGASDFYVVPTVHAIVMDHAATRSATLRFLQHGYFVSADQKQPILE